MEEFICLYNFKNKKGKNISKIKNTASGAFCYFG